MRGRLLRLGENSVAGKMLLIVFHPLDCMDIIKREKKQARLWVVPVLYLLAFLVNYAYIFLVHFPLESKNPADASLLLEAAMVSVPLFSWVVGSYLMTAITSGESTFLESLVASAYALVPYIVLTPLMALSSNLLGSGEAGVYRALRVIVLLWVLLLLLLALQRLNDYSLKKTVGVAVLSAAAVIVLWAVCLLLFSLTVQFVTFFTGIGGEIQLKFFT